VQCYDAETIIIDNMKIIFFNAVFLIFFLNANLFGQKVENKKQIEENLYHNLDSMGINVDPYLNQYEIDFFNYIFSEKKKDFNFKKKKIAFIAGGFGQINKKKYFVLEKEEVAKGYPKNGALILFNEKEKQESGGYDAVIMFSGKLIPTKKQIIKLLKEKR